MVEEGRIDRRSILTAATGAVVALTGCIGAGYGSGPNASTNMGDCSPPDEGTELETLLPPASDDRSRSVERKGGATLSDLGDAVAGVRAIYDDNDDDVLDDPFVEIIRFRKEQVNDVSEAASFGKKLPDDDQSTTATEELKQRLTRIAVDDSREGTGALLGRIGFVAAAPDRAHAKELLARSPALSTECRKANEVSSTAAEDDDSRGSSETPTSDSETHNADTGG
jgi:hypothetical protein